MSGGTDKHLVLVDLRDSHPDLTGKEAEAALADVGIVANENTVSGETRSPFVTSGIRIGTPGITTRGFAEAEAERVADVVADVLDVPADETVRSRRATRSTTSVRSTRYTDNGGRGGSSTLSDSKVYMVRDCSTTVGPAPTASREPPRCGCAGRRRGAEAGAQ